MGFFKRKHENTSPLEEFSSLWKKRDSDCFSKPTPENIQTTKKLKNILKFFTAGCVALSLVCLFFDVGTAFLWFLYSLMFYFGGLFFNRAHPALRSSMEQGAQETQTLSYLGYGIVSPLFTEQERKTYQQFLSLYKQNKQNAYFWYCFRHCHQKHLKIVEKRAKADTPYLNDLIEVVKDEKEMTGSLNSSSGPIFEAKL